MIDSIKLSSAGMNSRVYQQEVIANNLANVNTIGFKRDRAFVEVLNEAAMESPDKAEAVTCFGQGDLRETKNPLHFALNSEGFFVVETEEGPRYTRNGSFHLDGDGQLVLGDGLPVMGESGPIVVENTLEAGEEGELYQNGEMFDRLRIVTFEEPFPLKKVGNSLFAPIHNQVQEVDIDSVHVKQGFLEESNVNAIEEMVKMITSYRNFEADQKALKTQDDILSKAVNEVGTV